MMPSLFAILFAFVSSAAAGSTEPASQGPLGAWRGESKCVVKPSGCHDEDALYRVSATQQADRLLVSGNKIVDGKEINMGSGECSYDASSQSIDCPLPNGNAVHLQLHGDAMDGTMTLRDGTLWRKITLRRAENR